MGTDPVCAIPLSERDAVAASFYNGRIYLFCSVEHRDLFQADPERYSHNVRAMALKVGVMGAASGNLTAETRAAARELGRAVGTRGMVMVSGAAPGLPLESALGTQSVKGLSIGISPALSLDEHVHVYHSPVDGFDVLIYTGSGLMGREIVNIRSSDIVVIIGGHSGTLGEFAIAYDEGKLIGILQGTGGIADLVPELVSAIDKETGASVLYDSDPNRLIDRLVDHYVNIHFQRPSVFTRNGATGGHPLPG
ncbi:MAG TPA: YHS domain-containing protein [Thermoleophilia bacterium]|nr:YHS domain-containing protein [Thermoleophilia bacterium]